MSRIGLQVLGVLLVAGTAAFAATEPHAPHEHGAVRLQAALDGNILSIDLEIPAHDVVGFEHAPRDAAQRRAVADAVSLLKTPAAVVQMNAVARCVAKVIDVDSAMLAPQPDAHASHDHADFDVHYEFECSSPAALRVINVTLFKALPRLDAVRAEFIVNGKQGAAMLKRGDAELKI